MTIERIVKEIDARITYLVTRRNELEDRRRALRYTRPYRHMTDRELDDLPRSSQFWLEDRKYSSRISSLSSEIYRLRTWLEVLDPTTHIVINHKLRSIYG